MKRTLVMLLAAVAALPGVAALGAEPIPDLNAGPAVTIAAPDTFSAGAPFDVTGFVYAQLGLPVIFETAQPVPGTRVDVLVDDVVAASATTGLDGAYRVTLSLPAQGAPSRSIRAVAFRDSAAETSSRAVVTTIDRYAVELRVEPSTVSLSQGDSTALHAIATMNDGRVEDVTARAAWSSADPSVATVSGGVVSGAGPGSSTVTAVLDGVSATVHVTVA